MQAFENPACDTADGDEDSAFDPDTSNQESAAASTAPSDRTAENVLDGTALGILGVDNSLRKTLFEVATNTYVAQQLFAS